MGGSEPRASDRGLPALLFAVVCTVFVILIGQGVSIGDENHAGLLPVVRRILDPSYLPGDFGIELRYYHHRVFACVVAAFAATPLGETGALTVLTFAGLALIFFALWRLAASLNLTVPWRWLMGAMLASSFAFINHGVEANLFLGNGPIMPPTFAHGFILLSLNAMVRRRWNTSWGYAGLVALTHLQIGGLWLATLLIAMTVLRGWGAPREWLPGLLGMLLIAAPALVFLSMLLRKGLIEQLDTLADVAFRMPQHFVFYPNRVAAVGVYLVSLWLLWRHWRAHWPNRAAVFKPLVVVSVIISVFSALHYLDYYFLHMGWIARLQAIRLSPLLPVLGMLAIISALQGNAANSRLRPFVPIVMTVLLVSVRCGAALIRGRPLTLTPHSYTQQTSPWAEVCNWIDRHGPTGLYVTPPGHVGFTERSNRSTLVEFKINPDGGAGLREWESRLYAVTGGHLPQSSSRADVAQRLDRAYAELSAADMNALARRYGARYAVVDDSAVIHGRTLYENAGFRVIELH